MLKRHEVEILLKAGHGKAEVARLTGVSLVQFGRAVDHGISSERLGDGIDGNIAEYWELLFDLDTGS
jgi:hypothetical protein